MTFYACIVLLMLATLLDAQIIVDPDASIDGIRLVGGPSVNDGRLEILIGSTWGTVCKNPFGTANVKVVCRMLGYNSGGNTIGNIYRSRYGYGTGQIWMDRVQCTGNEDSLAECSHLGFGNTHNRNCGHSNEVVLRCNLHAVNDIRLVGGASSSEGRVEVFVNNTWGSICDDYFDERGAITICKMSGFSHPIAEIRDIGEYGRGSGSIWLDDVGCSNLQNNLTACYHAGYGLHNCHHGDDVAVKCGDAMISGVRLVNGSSSHGFLEISANNTWLSVCNKRFELDTAKIVCKMLGFQNKAPIVRTSYVWAPGKAWEFIGDCNANMSNLTECDHYALGLTDYCGAPIISMACTTIEDVRLVGGNTSFGRAEVLVVGEWGTICDDSFNDRAATVFCRMMGRPSGVFDLGTVSGGTGQIWLDDVICHGNETTLDDCNLRYTPDPECRHVEDVWIRCVMRYQNTDSLCKLIVFIQNITFQVSMYHIAAFAIIRYFMLVYPLTARAYVTASFAVNICLGIWIVTSLYNIPVALLYGERMIIYQGREIVLCYFHGSSNILDLTFANMVGLLTMVVVAICHLLKHWQVNRKLDTTAQERVSTDGRAVAVVIIVVFVTATPQYIPVMFHHAFGYPMESYHHIIWVVGAYNVFISSVINPFIYCFVSPTIRADILRVLCKRGQGVTSTWTKHT